MKKPTLPLILAFIASAAFTSPVWAGEKVTLDQVPEKVKETIKNHVKDGKIDEIEREKKKDKTVYEVEWTSTDGVEHEMHIGEDGKLVPKK
jgi:Putative beta-lactamase-inhibitor-like, PepSY-like